MLAIVAAIAVVATVIGVLYYHQVNGQQQQQGPPPLVPPTVSHGPPVKPGAVQLTPGQAAAVGLGPPSKAEIQADIAIIKANHGRNEAILNGFYKAVGKDASAAHVAAVLKSFPSMHCPGNQLSQCYGLSLAPGAAAQGISPPFEP